jgi:hypothetical protein
MEASMNVDWGAIVTQLLLILLPILVTSAITYISALAVKAIAALKARYPKWMDILDSYAPEVVAAAEQLRKSGVLPTAAAAKEYAVKTLQVYLQAHGISGVDVALIEAKIEAAVKDLPAFSPGVRSAPTPTPTSAVG